MNEKQFNVCKEQNKLSYSPYSNYKVSAAVLLKDGNIVAGMNIENASYSLCICAERCALFRAYAMGYKKEDIVSLMIYSPRDDSMPYPCGACRQVMSELMLMDTEVVVVNNKKEAEYFTVSELIPHSFRKENL